MISRDTVLEAYEILYGAKLDNEEDIERFKQAGNTKDLRRMMLLDERFEPGKGSWGEQIVSRKDIILGYRYILDATPESEHVINYRIERKITRRQFFKSLLETAGFKYRYSLLKNENVRIYIRDGFSSPVPEHVFEDLWR